MARPPRDPSLLSWLWGSAPSGSGGPSSAVGLTSLPIVNSHAKIAAMLQSAVFEHVLNLSARVFSFCRLLQERSSERLCEQLLMCLEYSCSVKCVREDHVTGARASLRCQSMVSCGEVGSKRT